MQITFDIEPMAIQSFRFRNAGHFTIKYQPKKNIVYKSNIGKMATLQLPENFTLMTGAVFCNWTFVFPPLKSWSKKKLNELNDASKFVYKTTKPDVTNLQKGTEDALTGIIWQDDALIVQSTVKKIYGFNPKIILDVFDL